MHIYRTEGRFESTFFDFEHDYGTNKEFYYWIAVYDRHSHMMNRLVKRLRRLKLINSGTDIRGTRGYSNLHGQESIDNIEKIRHETIKINRVFEIEKNRKRLKKITSKLFNSFFFVQENLNDLEEIEIFIIENSVMEKNKERQFRIDIFKELIDRLKKINMLPNDYVLKTQKEYSDFKKFPDCPRYYDIELVIEIKTDFSNSFTIRKEIIKMSKELELRQFEEEDREEQGRRKGLYIARRRIL